MANELDMGDGLEETVANIKDLNGRTALHFAAVGGRAHVCRYLTAEAKLDVNARDGKGIWHKLDCYKFQFRKRLYLNHISSRSSLFSVFIFTYDIGKKFVSLFSREYDRAGSVFPRSL